MLHFQVFEIANRQRLATRRKHNGQYVRIKQTNDMLDEVSAWPDRNGAPTCIEGLCETEGDEVVVDNVQLLSGNDRLCIRSVNGEYTAVRIGNVEVWISYQPRDQRKPAATEGAPAA